jgi:hypothetical protein
LVACEILYERELGDSMIVGKGLYLWNLTASVETYVKAAVEMGLTHVRVKIFDSVGSAKPFNNPTKIRELFAALRAKNISPTAWGYYTGYSPSIEAELTIRLVRDYKPDEYVVNAERYFKASGMAVKARDLMVKLGALSIPLGVTSYRYPTLHAPFPFREFLTHSDFYEPQVYWNKPGWATVDQPAAELGTSIKQLQAIYPGVDIRPIGRAYAGDGYPIPGPSPKEITQFLTASKDKYGLQSASFWSFDKIILGTNNAPLWKQAIAGFRWGGIIAPPPPVVELTLEEKVQKLWAAHPELSE